MTNTCARAVRSSVAFFVGCGVLSLAAMSGDGGRGGDQQILEGAGRAFNEIAKQSTPAVVSISAIKVPSRHGASHGGPQGIFPWPFGGDGGDAPGWGEGPRMLGVGSGVIISEDGLILTNNHVVENAERVNVLFGGDGEGRREELKAQVIGADPRTDLAIIRVKDKKGLPVVRFGDSDQVKVGDWALAVGSPFGLSHSVTSGIVSAKGRGRMGGTDVDDFIQTDAAINPGNSGGPLLNFKGEVVGINTAIFSQTGGYMGIGFAIPSNTAKKIADEIVARGRVVRGWIGVAAQDVDSELAKFFKTAGAKGSVLTDIHPEGPAAKGGMKIGDVIVKFAGRGVESSTSLRSAVTGATIGTTVPVEVIREGKSRTLQLRVREQPVPPSAKLERAGQAPPREGEGGLGLVTRDIPEDLARFFGLSSVNGAMVADVQPGSPAFDAGMAPGDVILRANDGQVKGMKEFRSFAKKLHSGDLAVLYVQRGEEKIFVPLKAG